MAKSDPIYGQGNPEVSISLDKSYQATIDTEEGENKGIDKDNKLKP